MQAVLKEVDAFVCVSDSSKLTQLPIKQEPQPHLLLYPNGFVVMPFLKGKVIDFDLNYSSMIGSKPKKSFTMFRYYNRSLAIELNWAEVFSI